VIHSVNKVIELYNHNRQRGSDCTVLTATGLVNGEWQILTLYKIETPELTDIKFGTGDYVREISLVRLRTKSGANPSTGASWQIVSSELVFAEF